MDDLAMIAAFVAAAALVVMYLHERRRADRREEQLADIGQSLYNVGKGTHRVVILEGDVICVEPVSAPIGFDTTQRRY